MECFHEGGPLKILYFSHYYPPEGNAPATRVSALAKRWVAMGHQVTVVTCAPNVPHGKVYSGYKNTLFPQREIKDGVIVWRVWTWVAPNKGFIGRIANYVSYMFTAFLAALFLHRPDVFIATSPQFFCGWAGVLYAYWTRWTSIFRRRPRFILEIRDIWPESIGAVDAINNRWILGFLQILERWMYWSADHIVSVGDGYKSRLVERKVPEKKISVVMNGWDNDLRQPTAEEIESIRSQWGLHGKFVCAYIGTIGMACGLDIYLRAAKLLQERGIENIVLLAVGDGAMREKWEEQASADGLKSIVFTGLQPKESMPAWLSIANVCFVHLKKTPLFETVIPSKIFESFGFRRPVLIGVHGEARKLVEASGGGMVMDPENENQLVDSLVGMQEARSKEKDLGDAGYAYVSSHFSRDHLSAKYVGILESVLEDRRLHPRQRNFAT